MFKWFYPSAIYYSIQNHSFEMHYFNVCHVNNKSTMLDRCVRQGSYWMREYLLVSSETWKINAKVQWIYSEGQTPFWQRHPVFMKVRDRQYCFNFYTCELVKPIETVVVCKGATWTYTGNVTFNVSSTHWHTVSSLNMHHPVIWYTFFFLVFLREARECC